VKDHQPNCRTNVTFINARARARFLLLSPLTRPPAEGRARKFIILFYLIVFTKINRTRDVVTVSRTIPSFDRVRRPHARVHVHVFRTKKAVGLRTFTPRIRTCPFSGDGIHAESRSSRLADEIRARALPVARLFRFVGFDRRGRLSPSTSSPERSSRPAPLTVTGNVHFSRINGRTR